MHGAESETTTAADAAPSPQPSPAKGPGRPKRPDVTAADVTGLKHFEKLEIIGLGLASEEELMRHLEKLKRLDQAAMANP